MKITLTRTLKTSQDNGISRLWLPASAAEESQEATALSLSSVAWILFPSPFFSFIEKTKADRKRIGLMSVTHR